LLGEQDDLAGRELEGQGPHVAGLGVEAPGLAAAAAGRVCLGGGTRFLVLVLVLVFEFILVLVLALVFVLVPVVLGQWCRKLAVCGLLPGLLPDTVDLLKIDREAGRGGSFDDLAGEHVLGLFEHKLMDMEVDQVLGVLVA
jgi:hypothetical protein